MPEQHVLLCRYHYDPVDRLAGLAPTSATDARFFYRKNRLASQIQGTVGISLLQADDQPLAQLQGGQATLLASDGQQSVVRTFQGGQQQELSYTAYGYQPAGGGFASLLGFNGERRDPLTGHYLLGNGYRAFNPVLMRFNSPDSLSPFGEGGINAYAYCQGDPVNYRDPTGHIVGPGYAFRKVRMPVSISSAAKDKVLPGTSTAKIVSAQPSKAYEISKDLSQGYGFSAKRRRLTEPDERPMIGSNTRGLPRVFPSDLAPGELRYKFYNAEHLDKLRGVELRGHIASSKKSADSMYDVWMRGSSRAGEEFKLLSRYVEKLMRRPAAKFSAAKREAITIDLDAKMADVRARQEK